MVRLNVGDLQQNQFLGFPPALWFKYPFSKDWFEDALSEARSGFGRNARRREIIFAVAFAESYWVEWVRDEIFKGDLDKVIDRLAGKKISAEDKWKKLTKELMDENLLKGIPELKTKFWQEWKLLIDYRDGLVHGVSSLPECADNPRGKKPFPAVNVLDTMEPGWPTKVTINLVKEFHSAAGTDPPTWLIEP